jgi:hypothetical protein
MDDSTLVTRKDAANRDKQYDLRTLVNHQISERNCTLGFLPRVRLVRYHLDFHRRQALHPLAEVNHVPLCHLWAWSPHFHTKVLTVDMNLSD